MSLRSFFAFIVLATHEMKPKGSRTGAQQAVARAQRKATGRQRMPRETRRTAPNRVTGADG